jgi:chromosome partitioning protein
MSKVIAFINFKGGVGKTSNTVNLGSVLAREYGKRVLLVDLDAQCNSTYWLLRNQERRAIDDAPQHTTCQIFLDHLVGTQIFDFDEAVIRGVPRSKGGNPHIATLDLLAAHVNLLDMEDRLSARTLQPFFSFLDKTLRPHAKQYDFVFLDCPPNIYNVAKNALFFADAFVIPYRPDFLSLSGLRVFASVVRRFQDQVSGFKPRHAHPLIAAVIVNCFKKNTNVSHEAINELELELGDLRAKKLVHSKARLITPSIRDCVKMAECSSEHLPVIIHSESAISSEDYIALGADFLQHFQSI